VLGLGADAILGVATFDDQLAAQGFFELVVVGVLPADQVLVGGPSHGAVELVGVGAHRLAHGGDVRHGFQEALAQLGIARVG